MLRYLFTSGTRFALVAVAHVRRTVAELSRLATAPRFILEGPGLGLGAGALSLWAGRLSPMPARA